MLPLSSHLEGAAPGSDGKRGDYKGHFFLFKLDAQREDATWQLWRGGRMQTASRHVGSLWKIKGFLSSSGSSRLENLQLEGCVASLSRGSALPGVEHSPRAETGAERTSYVVKSGGSKGLKRRKKKGGGRVGGEWCGAGGSGGGGGEACGGIFLQNTGAALSSFERSPPPTPLPILHGCKVFVHLIPPH